jgi:hypothetical protein
VTAGEELFPRAWPLWGGRGAGGPDWQVVCGRRVMCVEEVGLFTAGFFPRLQVVACTSFKGQATVWLTRRSISMSFRVGCMQISVAVHEGSRGRVGMLQHRCSGCLF